MNLSTVEQVVALLGEHGVYEIEADMDGTRIHVRRSHFPIPAAISDALPPAEATLFVPLDPAEAAPPSDTLLFAPMVGIFHHATPLLNTGMSVTAGQKIGAIEAMKLMNDVTADDGGRILEVLIDDGAPVEYGQPLLRLSRL